jgi:N-acetyl-anhydromuramyl-L-alanine amidase AmpD
MSGLKRVIIHWTAGTNKVNEIDKEHYHFIVDGTGRVVNGDHDPEDNLSISDGLYAAHTRGANSGAIGVSMAGMMGATGPTQLGLYPMTKIQWDACMALVKKLAKKYGIPVSRTSILTHAEVEKTLGIKQRGKVDIAFGVPGKPELKTATDVGDYIRASVK